MSPGWPKRRGQARPADIGPNNSVKRSRLACPRSSTRRVLRDRHTDGGSMPSGIVLGMGVFWRIRGSHRLRQQPIQTSGQIARSAATVCQGTGVWSASANQDGPGLRRVWAVALPERWRLAMCPPGQLALGPVRADLASSTPGIGRCPAPRVGRRRAPCPGCRQGKDLGASPAVTVVCGTADDWPSGIV